MTLLSPGLQVSALWRTWSTGAWDRQLAVLGEGVLGHPVAW